MKKILIGGIVLFCIVNLSAQAPDTLWTKTYGWIGIEDRGNSVQQTADGGYFITGYTGYSGNGDRFVYLIKTDSLGDTLWTKRYRNYQESVGQEGLETTDGGYIIAGSTYNTVYRNDVYIVRTDSLGDTLWTKTYGGNYEHQANSVQQTVDSGYIIAGVKTSNGPDNWDIWLLKTDANGDTLWTKTIGTDSFEFAESVRGTADGGYIIVAWSRGHGIGEQDVYLVKTNADGDTTWTRRYGGTEDDRGHSVQQTFDGGYIVAGITSSFGIGERNVYLIKTNSIGDTLWTRVYGEKLWNYAESVQQTPDGGYIIAGWRRVPLEIYLLRTDANGDTLWTTTYSGGEYAFSVDQTSDGGYIIAGWTFSSPYGDVYLIKTEPDISVEEETSENLNDVRIPGFVYGNLLKLKGISKYTEVDIFDILGREVLNQEVSPQKSYVKLNNLTAGIYFLLINERKPELHKFVLIK